MTSEPIVSEAESIRVLEREGVIDNGDKCSRLETMNAIQAEKILNQYGAAFADQSEIVKRKSLLPCSIARIKYAYYVYIDALMENGLFSKEINDNLTVMYSYLGYFMDDDRAQKTNDAMRRISEKQDSEEDASILSDFTKDAIQIELMEELIEYIKESYKEHNKITQ